jgi:hypothetical protein
MNLSVLYMVLDSIFVSRFGITDLVNKIKIYTNLIKLFRFEINIILFLFKSFIKVCNNIWEYLLNKYIKARIKIDANMHFFQYIIVKKKEKSLFLYFDRLISIMFYKGVPVGRDQKASEP